jgi:uncharacterized protein Yka (UPF0111/DUF47 family)
MPAKSLIIGELGQEQLLLPQFLGRALAANDRVKLCFSLLQAAESHANHPEQPMPTLFAALTIAGIGDPDLERSLPESRLQPDGSLQIPGAARLRGMILDDISTMRAPLALAESAGAEAGAGAMETREQALIASLPEFAGDRVPSGVVDAITSADRRRGDRLHLLVMDLHKALNAIEGQLATEDVDGARAWRIAEGDRPLLRAFMAGVNQTAPLKFDHPGLGTTATRTGERLVIQNDVGTTDAHVLVLQITGLTAALTYTDVHAARLEFFQSLFKPFAVRWDGTLTRHSDRIVEEANYYLSVGHFEAANPEALERYLTFLGSRIVFLIDWNRARKCLREFLRKEDVVPLLKWAADQNLGHRGFLALGGERLLYEAIEFAQQTPLSYGQSLHELIGPDVAVEYLRFVLRAAAEGLLKGRSERFIRDEIRAELAGCFHSAMENLLGIAASHATFVFELATAVRDGLAVYGEPGSAEHLARTAQRARKWEQDADALVSRTRALVQQSHKPCIYLALLREADDAADALEEAAFLMTLLSKVAPPGPLLEPLHSLAALLVGGAQEMVKLIEAAGHVHRDGAREDLQDFLEAVDRIVGIEHETDSAQRAMTSALILEAPDFRALQLLLLLANALEEAADALLRSALVLRDHLLNDVVTA